MSSSSQAKEELFQHVIDRFWETIPPTWNLIRGRIRTTAAENYGITFEQFHILRHIRKGIHSVGELADVKQISRPAVSQAVEMLVTKGLITRQPKPDDRRFVQLELTDNGNELLNEIFKKNREWMMEKLALLSSEEIFNILLAMDAFQKAFKEPEQLPMR